VRGAAGWAWAKSATFKAGERAHQHLQLGDNPESVGTSRPIQYGSVRCGFLDDRQAPENFTAYVVLPDNGSRVGPIDLPFEGSFPLPLRIEIQPDAHPAAPVDVVASVAYPGTKLRWACTRRVVVPAFAVPAVHVVIPQWVHSVSVCEQDAAVTLFDATGAVLCAITGPVWDVVRPRAAVLMATTAVLGTAVVYSYQA
jgi:hypothetical protein